jgi:hypothetical protein
MKDAMVLMVVRMLHVNGAAAIINLPFSFFHDFTRKCNQIGTHAKKHKDKESGNPAACP